MKSAPIDIKKARFLPSKLQFILVDRSVKEKLPKSILVTPFSQKSNSWNKEDTLRRADLVVLGQTSGNEVLLADKAFISSHEAGCVWVTSPTDSLSSALIKRGFTNLDSHLFQKLPASTPEEYGENYIDRWGDTDFLANAKLAATQILEHMPKEMNKGTMKVIDVGCLNGYIMESVRREGVNNIFGTDISYFLAVERILNPELLNKITVCEFSKN